MCVEEVMESLLVVLQWIVDTHRRRGRVPRGVGADGTGTSGGD
jgi:hypothetical protein